MHCPGTCSKLGWSNYVKKARYATHRRLFKPNEGILAGRVGLEPTTKGFSGKVCTTSAPLARCETVFPDALTPPSSGRFQPDGSDLVGWLRRI